MWSISLLNGHPPQTQSVIMLASRQLKVSQPTSPKEPGGPKVIIPLALITDLCVLSAEYISRDLCTAALRGLCVHVHTHSLISSLTSVQHAWDTNTIMQVTGGEKTKLCSATLAGHVASATPNHDRKRWAMCFFFNVEIHWWWMFDGKLESSWPSPSFSS